MLDSLTHFFLTFSTQLFHLTSPLLAISLIVAYSMFSLWLQEAVVALAQVLDLVEPVHGSSRSHGSRRTTRLRRVLMQHLVKGLVEIHDLGAEKVPQPRDALLARGGGGERRRAGGNVRWGPRVARIRHCDPPLIVPVAVAARCQRCRDGARGRSLPPTRGR